jgi:hypothetical protein
MRNTTPHIPNGIRWSFFSALENQALQMISPCSHPIDYKYVWPNTKKTKVMTLNADDPSSVMIQNSEVNNV